MEVESSLRCSFRKNVSYYTYLKDCKRLTVEAVRWPGRLSSSTYQVFHLNFSVLLDGTTALRPVLDQWTAEWDVAKLLREVSHQQCHNSGGTGWMDALMWMGCLNSGFFECRAVCCIVPAFTAETPPIPPPPFTLLPAPGFLPRGRGFDLICCCASGAERERESCRHYMCFRMYYATRPPNPNPRFLFPHPFNAYTIPPSPKHR